MHLASCILHLASCIVSWVAGVARFSSLVRKINHKRQDVYPICAIQADIGMRDPASGGTSKEYKPMIYEMEPTKVRLLVSGVRFQVSVKKKLSSKADC